MPFRKCPCRTCWGWGEAETGHWAALQLPGHNSRQPICTGPGEYLQPLPMPTPTHICTPPAQTLVPTYTHTCNNPNAHTHDHRHQPQYCLSYSPIEPAALCSSKA